MSLVSPSAVASILPGINTTIISQSLCSPARVWLPPPTPSLCPWSSIQTNTVDLAPPCAEELCEGHTYCVLLLCSGCPSLCGSMGCSAPHPLLWYYQLRLNCCGSTSYSWNANSLWTVKRECTEEIRRPVFWVCCIFWHRWNIHVECAHSFSSSLSRCSVWACSPLCLGYFIQH